MMSKSPNFESDYNLFSISSVKLPVINVGAISECSSSSANSENT